MVDYGKKQSIHRNGGALVPTAGRPWISRGQIIKPKETNYGKFLL